MPRTPHKIDIEPSLIVKVANDAAIASEGMADGRFVPVIIVDATNRPDLHELARIHGYIDGGDVECCWCCPRGEPDVVALSLDFIRPLSTRAHILFDVRKYGGLVDTLIYCRGFYFQPGAPGDRFATSIDAPRILIEIGDLEFDEDWNRILRRTLTKMYREHVGPHKAPSLVERHIAEFRSVFQDFRARPRADRK
jgi:hypothetical protein